MRPNKVANGFLNVRHMGGYEVGERCKNILVSDNKLDTFQSKP